MFLSLRSPSSGYERRNREEDINNNYSWPQIWFRICCIIFAMASGSKGVKYSQDRPNLCSDWSFSSSTIGISITLPWHNDENPKKHLEKDFSMTTAYFKKLLQKLMLNTLSICIKVIPIPIIKEATTQNVDLYHLLLRITKKRTTNILNI